MTDANLLGFRYGRQADFDTIAAAMQTLRITGESLKQNTETTVSAEIINTRDTADIIRVNLTGGGGFDGELSAGTYDDFILDALQAGDAGIAAGASAAWPTTEVEDGSTATETDGTAFTFATGPNTISTSEATWGGYSTQPAVGDLIRVDGSTSNDGFFTVTVLTDANTVEVAETVAAETGLAGTTLTKMALVSNGVTKRFMTMEKDFGSEITGSRYSRHLGHIVDGMTLGITPQGIMSCGFTFLGKSEASNASAIASPSAATTTTPFNGITNVPTLTKGGTAFTATEVTMNIVNGLRGRNVIGTEGPTSVGAGRFEATGTLVAFLTAGSDIDDYLNFAETSLRFRTYNATDGGYEFELPAIKFTDGQRLATGVNTDVLATLNWTAKKDATSGKTMRCWKVPAAA